jgi:hypothetical protein
MFWCRQLTTSPLGDALHFYLHFFFDSNVHVMCFLLVPHSPPELRFWLRCDRFDILGLVVATVTFAPPSLSYALVFCFHFFSGWKVLEVSSIMICHLSLEVLFWLRCGHFEIFGLIVAYNWYLCTTAVSW